MDTAGCGGSKAVSPMISTHNVNESSQKTATQPRENMFPKKELAIIMNTEDELNLSDYVINIGNIIGPRNITFASRMSNNRICLYLSNPQAVDTIINNHSKMTINNKEISIRRLISPARRLIISNVCPSVPHTLIEAALKRIGLQLVSPLSFMRAGILGEEYSHILSFRRQVYVKPDDDIDLPSSLVLKFEETSYRIFLTYDNMVCFQCKQPGHIARHCPGQNIGNDEVSQTRQNLTAEKKITDNLIALSPPTEDVDLNQTKKRAAPSTISPPNTPSTENENPEGNSSKTCESSTSVFLKPPKPATKKAKKENSSHSEPLQLTDVALAPVQEVIQSEPSSFVLDFKQIIHFLENAQGTSDVLSVAQQYTTDINGLMNMLTRLHPYFPSRNLKTRCTRLRKKLSKQLSQEDNCAESDTDTSVSSY